MPPHGAMSISERAVAALKEIRETLTLWMSGKITHESGMDRINEIARKYK